MVPQIFASTVRVHWHYVPRRFGAMKITSILLGLALVGGGTFLLLARSGASPAAGQGGCTDQDGDGYGLGCAAGPDGNDHDPAIHPGAAEVCNFKDDDDNGLVDDLDNCPAPALDPRPVPIPAGSFAMGSNVGAADEKPVHQVAGSAFVMDRYEVSNSRYLACVNAGSCAPPILVSSNRRKHYFDDPAFADYPVIHVSWKQAVQFCAFAGGRLPSEAEWERAAAGSETPRTYPWGDSPPDCSKANFAGCVGDTDRVGRRLAGRSPYGAFDLAGNVWEWTADWYDAGYYAHSPVHDPKGPAEGSLKVMRGGCWVSGASSLRTTCRKAELPNAWAPNVGFRCVYPEVRR
jgi:formylglycine-generating enzyme required for sulfatase activity